MDKDSKRLQIRRAETGDLSRILEIYAQARVFQREHGNPDQWAGGYPQREILEEDLSLGRLYVVVQDEEIRAVFMFMLDPEPTYEVIYEGDWPDSLPYGTMHRLASDGRERGIGRVVFEWCAQRCPRLRVDTHRDNLPMQRAVEKYGFRYCGIIRLADGSERLAYQFTR
ncbi:MAG: GNAT family N-acetyltransferase [Clostridium sp.]|nr:GNAT family N-acetyltransferase [Acetatifactor muris]MCM1527480.1 GNAT family N-acetyltransferase [Bacteroides sp.]MCM1562076.1 GNAT family N-acetyltransferase [Clostridium sp.]